MSRMLARQVALAGSRIVLWYDVAFTDVQGGPG